MSENESEHILFNSGEKNVAAYLRTQEECSDTSVNEHNSFHNRINYPKSSLLET